MHLFTQLPMYVNNNPRRVTLSPEDKCTFLPLATWGLEAVLWLHHLGPYHTVGFSCRLPSDCCRECSSEGQLPEPRCTAQLLCGSHHRGTPGCSGELSQQTQLCSTWNCQDFFFQKISIQRKKSGWGRNRNYMLVLRNATQRRKINPQNIRKCAAAIKAPIISAEHISNSESDS